MVQFLFSSTSWYGHLGDPGDSSLSPSGHTQQVNTLSSSPYFLFKDIELNCSVFENIYLHSFAKIH